MVIRFDRAINDHTFTALDQSGWRAMCLEQLRLCTSIALRNGWELVEPNAGQDLTLESYEFGGGVAICIYGDDWRPEIEPDSAITGFVPHTGHGEIERMMIGAMRIAEGYLLLRVSEQRIDLTQRELRLLEVRSDPELRFDGVGDELLELIHIRQSRQTSQLKALKDFEELVESDPPERDVQMFFEAWPEFLTPLQLLDARPHIVLETPARLIPDFAIQVAGQAFYDLLELKRPGERVIVGTENRPRLTSVAASGLSQLRQYREALADPRVQERVRSRYGLDLFKPSLHLVIGRATDVNCREARRAINNAVGGGETITTYDQLIDVARSRLGLPPRALPHG